MWRPSGTRVYRRANRIRMRRKQSCGRPARNRHSSTWCEFAAYAPSRVGWACGVSREGVVLVVRALDRLAGSKRIAIEVIRDLGKRGLRLRSLTEPFLDVDASTPMGEAVIGIMAVLAQLRMSTIRENTRRGLAHARTEGRVGGRRPRVTGDRL